MSERRGVVHHPTNQTPTENVPVMPVEDTFRDDEIIYLICGKGAMKTLARHLNYLHNMKPRQYRKLFGLEIRQTADIEELLRGEAVIRGGTCHT